MWVLDFRNEFFGRASWLILVRFLQLWTGRDRLMWSKEFLRLGGLLLKVWEGFFYYCQANDQTNPNGCEIPLELWRIFYSCSCPSWAREVLHSLLYYFHSWTLGVYSCKMVRLFVLPLGNWKKNRAELAYPWSKAGSCGPCTQGLKALSLWRVLWYFHWS
jgi:hypothetical protein